MGVALDIKRDARGVYYARPYLGTDPATGKPFRPFRSFPNASSEAEALEMAERWLDGIMQAATLGSGAPLLPLVKKYIAVIETSGAPANTVNTYRIFAGHLGHLGKVVARDVTPMMLDDLYAHLIGEGLSPRTVSTMHWFLAGAYHWLESAGILQVNPVRGATPPRWREIQPEAWEEDEVPLLRDAFDRARTCPYKLRRAAGIAATIALYSGARIGETCALRWRDVNRRTESIRIRGTLTTDVHGRPHYQAFTKGRKPRTLGMPAIFWERIDEWRAEQRDRGAAVGQADPVVTTGLEWARPDSVGGAFKTIVQGVGLEGTFHKLRHTHATILIAMGVSPRVVQERLGHAEVATTLAYYAHVLPAHDFEAAASFADVSL